MYAKLSHSGSRSKRETSRQVQVLPRMAASFRWRAQSVVCTALLLTPVLGENPRARASCIRTRDQAATASHHTCLKCRIATDPIMSLTTSGNPLRGQPVPTRPSAAKVGLTGSAWAL